MRELGTEQLEYIASQRLFIGGSSVLGNNLHWIQRMFRNDPHQLGICLRSHKTASVKRFQLIYFEERQGWANACVLESIGSGNPIRVYISNDLCRVDGYVVVLPEYDD